MWAIKICWLLHCVMWTLWQESNNLTFNGVMFNWNSLKSFLLRSLYDWTNFLGSLHCKFLFIFPCSLKIERWTSGNTRKDRIQLLKNWGGPYRLKDEGESLEMSGHVQMRVINAPVRGWVDSSGGNEKRSRITKKYNNRSSKKGNVNWRSNKEYNFGKKAYLWLTLTSLLWIHYIGKISVFSSVTLHSELFLIDLEVLFVVWLSLLPVLIVLFCFTLDIGMPMIL